MTMPKAQQRISNAPAKATYTLDSRRMEGGYHQRFPSSPAQKPNPPETEEDLGGLYTDPEHLLGNRSLITPWNGYEFFRLKSFPDRGK